MPLISAALATTMLLTTPPVPGDDRTAILYAVNAAIDALAGEDHEALTAMLETEGNITIVDQRNAARVTTTTAAFAKLREPSESDGPVMIETLGVPTLFQRGAIAHVWAPYRFSIAGRLSHCGSDSFTLVERDGRWRLANLTYTVESADRCNELGAPARDG